MISIPSAQKGPEDLIPRLSSYYIYAAKRDGGQHPILQRTNTENWKQIFPEKELCSYSPNFHIHMSVTDLFIPSIDLPILLQEICGPITDT
jgi:hypothetical protein